VPHPGELGYDTWPKDAWLYIGGTNVWGEFSVDEKRGIAYFPVGSPTYDYYGADRKGNDLFSDCLLALDARTGKYLWHFQEVHHDLWDYDPTAAPQLTTVQIDGKSVDVVAHAGKTGFLYVLDRVTGKPIWPIEEKPVPQTDVPGEQISPTQPFPTKPAAFSRQTFSEKDVNPYVLTPEERQKVKKQVADARNEGMFTPPSAKRDTLMMPGDRGGANWGMTAANPTNGMVFVAGINAPAVLHLYTEEPASLGFGLVRQGGPPGGQVYQQHCQMCHGANREGAIGPSLVDITKRVSPAIVRSTIVNGKGEMPPFTTLSETDIASLVSFLDDPSGAGGVKFDFSALMPKATKVEGDTPGPVVASGGAPAGKLDPDMKIPPIGPWGMMGGPPYPKGVAAPPARYYSAWNVMYKWANPPWTTLTAYDLNNGTIKWQIPVGEDAGANKEGAKDTGALEEQRGPIVTAAGIVFMATVDGKVRAYDEQTGATLWVGLLPGGSKAIPAMYELNGRQYLVVNATWPLAAPGGDSNAAGTTAPTGYVAFALPETK
jgi:quinoprotein glucose dehydrogenase